jgi:CcmD family protein
VNDYVVAAFAVVWFVLLVYVAVVALRTSRMAREVELLARLAERRAESGSPPERSA